jgi:hypothetical protein
MTTIRGGEGEGNVVEPVADESGSQSVPNLAPRKEPDPLLHHLEKIKVLCPRFPLHFLRELRSKEWWYTGVYDPGSDVYISWYFIRVNLVDKFIMTVFDPQRAENDLPRVSQLCTIDHRQQAGDGLCLVARGKGLQTDYRLRQPRSWHFALQSPALSADVTIGQTIKGFTKFDSEMQDRYAILHYFQSRANGQVTVPDGSVYQLEDALVYQDHCYGRVPRKTGWHWIAVQNHHVALTVLVNYGANAQRYAQVWMSPATHSPRPDEWVRLEQNVSFEREAPADDAGGSWTVTSTDLDLVVEVRKVQHDRTKIPPLLGIIVNLSHTEAFVKVSGRVRIDGRWMHTGDLHGVLEQHQGRW